MSYDGAGRIEREGKVQSYFPRQRSTAYREKGLTGTQRSGEDVLGLFREIAIGALLTLSRKFPRLRDK